MANSLVAALGATWPDSRVIMDYDAARDGFGRWQSLHTPSAETTYTAAPLSLAHPSLPGPALVGITNSVPLAGVGSQIVAMWRTGHWEAASSPIGAGPGIVDFECEFAFGGESPTGHTPGDLFFMVDEMYGGVRHFWKARWRLVNGNDGSRSQNWMLASQAEDNYVDTGFVSDFPWNGNKGSLSRIKLSIDLKNRQYLSLEANRDTFNLSTVPSITPPGANGNPVFDDPLFEDGLNFMVGVRNRTNQNLHGWVGITRARGTLRKAV